MTEAQRLKHNKRVQEYSKRYYEMVRKWEAEGHPYSGCSGHTYAPSAGCPAPEVHDRMRERE